MNEINNKERILKIIQRKNIENKLNEFSTIGERLRFLRKDCLKLSRAKLSAEIGIDANMLNKYENSYFIPKVDRIKEFASFYDIPKEYITGEAKSKLFMDDLYLINNLAHYCWEISHGLRDVINLDELVIAVLNASAIAITSINQYCIDNNDDSCLMYVYWMISGNDNKNRMMCEYSFDAVNLLLSDLIANYESKKIKDKFNLDNIFNIIDYSVNTLAALTKEDYNNVIQELQPVIDSFVYNNTER